MSKWEVILNKAITEPRQDTWKELDFSNMHFQWLNKYTLCYLLKCTAREHPNWSSSKLYNFLYGWAMGVHRIGPGERYERQGANADDERRVIISPVVLWCFNEWWINEIA